MAAPSAAGEAVLPTAVVVVAPTAVVVVLPTAVGVVVAHPAAGEGAGAER